MLRFSGSAHLTMYAAILRPPSVVMKPLNDSPLNDSPLNDSPLNDSPLNDSPLNDKPLNDKPLNDSPFSVCRPLLSTWSSSASDSHPALARAEAIDSDTAAIRRIPNHGAVSVPT